MTPQDVAAACIEREEATVPRRQVETSVCDRGRELEERRIVVEDPEPPERRAKPIGRRAVCGEVVAVSRPRDSGRSPGRARSRRHELDRRRTVNVAKLMLPVDRERAEAAADEDGDGTGGKERALHEPIGSLAIRAQRLSIRSWTRGWRIAPASVNAPAAKTLAPAFS